MRTVVKNRWLLFWSLAAFSNILTFTAGVWLGLAIC